MCEGMVPLWVVITSLAGQGVMLLAVFAGMVRHYIRVSHAAGYRRGHERGCIAVRALYGIETPWAEKENLDGTH